MTLSIARKEFVDLVRDGRFRWAAAIVTLLLVAAMAVGWRGWREVRAEHEQAQAEARRHFEGQEEKKAPGPRGRPQALGGMVVTVGEPDSEAEGRTIAATTSSTPGKRRMASWRRRAFISQLWH